MNPQPRTQSGFQIPAGKDRHQGSPMKIWGLIPLTIKLSARDTGGELLVFEHNNMGKGGPPRHIHYAQDEWFYVVAGEFAVEVGDDKFRLKPGDSLFAPRMIPHAWAHISNQPGTLITSVSPAGTFETFILDTTKHAALPPQAEVERVFEQHGMKIVGPPLRVD